MARRTDSTMIDMLGGDGRGDSSGRGYSIGTYQDSNGFKVKTDDGSWVGWVYPMDYIPGCEGTWGAISSVVGDATDRSLYGEGFHSRHEAAVWLITRWSTGKSADTSSSIHRSGGDEGC